jgi:hypothetical protein
VDAVPDPGLAHPAESDLDRRLCRRARQPNEPCHQGHHGHQGHVGDPGPPWQHGEELELQHDRVQLRNAVPEARRPVNDRLAPHS